jgi:hypothetical protein
MHGVLLSSPLAGQGNLVAENPFDAPKSKEDTSEPTSRERHAPTELTVRRLRFYRNLICCGNEHKSEDSPYPAAIPATSRANSALCEARVPIIHGVFPKVGDPPLQKFKLRHRPILRRGKPKIAVLSWYGAAQLSESQK